MIFNFEELCFCVIPNNYIYIFQDNTLVHSYKYPMNHDSETTYFICRNIYLQHVFDNKNFTSIVIDNFNK